MLALSSRGVVNMFSYSSDDTADAIQPEGSVRLEEVTSNDSAQNTILHASFVGEDEVLIVSGTVVKPYFERVEYVEEGNITSLVVQRPTGGLLLESVGPKSRVR